MNFIESRIHLGAAFLLGGSQVLKFPTLHWPNFRGVYKWTLRIFIRPVAIKPVPFPLNVTFVSKIL